MITDLYFPCSSFLGILQARILECVAVPFSRGSSQSRDRTQGYCTVDRFFTSWVTGEVEVMKFQLSYFMPKRWSVKVLHSICQQIWKTHQWPQDWKRLVFISIPNKGNAKQCSNYCTISLISHANREMLKTLSARLQQYMNWELPNVKAGFRKGRRTRDQIANIHWIIEKAREFQKKKNLLLLYAKAFDWVAHN